MREDIYGTLKNAIERGAPLEQAIQSLVSAGYKETDVIEVVQAIQTGTQITQSPIQTKQITQSQQIRPPQFTQQPIMREPTLLEVPLKKGPSVLIIILVIILLLSIAGFIASLLYREQLATLLQNLLK